MIPGTSAGDVDAGRIRLHYVEAGAGGPPVVLLHGFPEFHYSWRRQIPFLSQHFRTIAFDLPGYAASGRPRRGYGIARLVGDLTAALDRLDIDRAHVVGHDWGGVLAWGLAALAPRKVARLAILNAPHPVGFLRGLRPSQMLRSWYMVFFQIPWLPERSLARHDLEDMFRSMRAVGGPMFSLSDEEKARYREAFPDSSSFRAPLAYYRAAFRQGPLAMWRLARTIDAPTLSIWGEKDGALGKHLVDGFARYAPDLTKRFLPEAGHWVHQEEPDRVNEWLLEFLRG